MARTVKRRLKVCHTTLGFYESIVAAANQREALEAWGVSQNLFAERAAKIEDDAEAVKAALAAPNQPLRRPIGSKGAYALDPESPQPPKAKGETSKPTRPKPDRRKLNAAEAVLKDVQARQSEEAKELAARRSQLETDEARAQARWKTDEDKAQADLRAARDTYHKAGG